MQIVGRHAAAACETTAIAAEPIGVAPPVIWRAGKPIAARGGVVRGVVVGMVVVLGMVMMAAVMATVVGCLKVGMAHGMPLTMYLKI
ncbi:hypothetical protein DVB37_25260 [Achromobacter sp. B7]|nr:hypothetical protein DVB37_25260 [Achromobacter sp. B7]